MKPLFSLLVLAVGATIATADSPFACDVHAMTPAVRKHHFDEVIPALRNLLKGVKELPDGFAFELKNDTAAVQLAGEFAANERLCCPFFDIAIRIEREHGKLWLQLTGREGTKDFIRADFARWL